VQYMGATRLSLPAGIFSTADLLLEDMLVQPPPPGRRPLTINLNQSVHTLSIDPNNPNRVTGVVCYDTLAGRTRTFQANAVVLCAGTIESAKIALQSGLNDRNGLIGQGITDHMIRYRHFVVPPGQGEASSTDSAKLVLQHPQATTAVHSFDIVVELGAEFNQGRYIDPNDLARDERLRNGYMLCEVVFQYYSPLLEGNYVAINGDPANPVTLNVQAANPTPALIAEADQVASTLLTAYNAEPVLGEGPGLGLQIAAIGGVAHEVGTLRMAGDESGVVDQNLKFLAYDNLYACDNSVFPVSPAANPSLTLVALALRLASQLTMT
jgi:choline dehydrogenase-like flavoprotein